MIEERQCIACDGTGKQRRAMLVGDKMEIFYSPVAKCYPCDGTGVQKVDEPEPKPWLDNHTWEGG